MEGLDGMVEREIRDGMERGLFDNLPGKGQPIDLRPENPYEERLAGVLQRILRENGVSHPVIEAVRAVDREVEDMRAGLQNMRRRFKQSGDAREWEAVCDRFRAEVREFNRRLMLHNLKAPVVNFQRLRLDAEAEILRAERQS